MRHQHAGCSGERRVTVVVIVTAYDLTRVSLTGQTDAGTLPTPLGSGQTNEVGLHANREAEIPGNFAKTVAVVIAAVIATSSHLPPHCRLASIAVVVAPDPRLSAVLLGQGDESNGVLPPAYESDGRLRDCHVRGRALVIGERALHL